MVMNQTDFNKKWGLGMKWCSHIKWTNSVIPQEPGWFWNHERLIADSKNWSYCPECGAPRPKEPDKLRDHIRTTLVQHHAKYNSREDWMEAVSDALAKTAIDTVMEIIDEVYKPGIAYQVQDMTNDAINRRLCDELKERLRGLL